MEKKINSHISFIQIVCALLIINHHTSALQVPLLVRFTKGGFILNTIFVFLSGYLLSLSYSRHSNWSYKKFIFRRFKRIYPSFLILVVITLLLEVIINSEADLTIYFSWLTGFGYFLGKGYMLSSPHLWFVSVILTCYLLFIPSFRLLKNSPFLVLSSVLLMGILYNSWFTEEPTLIYKNSMNTVGMRFFYHYFIFILSIWFQQRFKDLDIHKPRNFILLLICGTIYFWSISTDMYSWLALIFVIPLSFYIIFLLYRLSSYVNLNGSWFLKLGKIPYELYLVHYIVIYVVKSFIGSNLVSFVLVYPVSIYMAILVKNLSDKLVEKLNE